MLSDPDIPLLLPQGGAEWICLHTVPATHGPGESVTGLALNLEEDNVGVVLLGEDKTAKIIALVRRAMLGRLTLPCDYSSAERALVLIAGPPEEMDRVLKRIAAEVEKQYGVRPHVRDLKPMDGVEFVYALNLTRCIGCRKCVHACVAENNQSRNPEIQYIRVLRMPHGTFDVEKAELNRRPEEICVIRQVAHDPIGIPEGELSLIRLVADRLRDEQRLCRPGRL
jgi:ferredoxin